MIRQRYVLTVLVALGIIALNLMNVSLSIAIIAMVNKTYTKNATDHNCPQYSVNESVRKIYHGEKLDWPRQLQGLVLSSYSWSFIVMSAPAGTLAQRYGGKWIIGGGILWTSVLTVISPFVAKINVYFYIVLRVLQGIGESVVRPAIFAMLGRWSPRDENSFMLSITMAGDPFGTIAAQLIAGPLSSSTFLGGWPSVFYLSGAVGILWFTSWCFLAYNSPNSHPWISDEERDHIKNSVEGSQEEANKKSVPWRRILLSRYVWVYTIVNAIYSWLIFTLITCLPQFLSDVLCFNLTDNSLVASAPYLAFFIPMNIFTWLSEHIVTRGWIGKTNVRKLFTLLAFCGSGACLFGITFTSCNRLVVIVLLIVSYIFLSASWAGSLVNPLDLSPEYSGAIYGIGSVFSNAFATIAPIVTDNITTNGTLQEWNLVFYITGGACLFAGILFLLFSSAEYQRWIADNEDEDSLLVKEDQNSECVINA